MAEQASFVEIQQIPGEVFIDISDEVIGLKPRNIVWL